jgi:hypothetical protein
MYVVWKKRKLSAARRGPRCHHGAAHRYALKPVIVRSAPGAPQEYEVVARLPAFRSCCRRDPAARAAWWARVDPVLDRLRLRCRVRRQEVDLPRLERALRLRIPRPAPPPGPPPTRPPAQAAAPPPAPAPCWATLGVPPGSGLARIKERRLEAHLELTRRGADLAAYQALDRAAFECIALLTSGKL